jgi:hypothetical protein
MDRNNCSGIADFQIEVKSHSISNLKLDCFPDDRFKTGRVDRNPVVTRSKRGKTVVAFSSRLADSTSNGTYRFNRKNMPA